MPQFEFTVLIFALRYAANRLSYAPSLVCGYALDQRRRMSDEQIENLITEINNLIRYREYADDVALTELMKLQRTLKEVGNK